MPRTVIPVNQVTRAGIANVTATACDAVNGNQCTNNGLNTWLEVTNSAGVSGTITVQPTRTVDGQSVAPVSHTIPATTTLPVKMGPFSTLDYGPVLQFNGSAATILVTPYSF